MKNYDFIGIGDTVTDAFIELEDATVNCDINREHCTLSMRFADKIPYKDVHVIPAVGNSANASVSAARLGLKSALVTNLGDDNYGKDCIKALGKENVATEFIKVHEGHKTNYHYVLLFDGERTILIKHEKYPYTFPDIGDPKWIYLSSLGAHSLLFHKEIASYLKGHPDIKVAFQPGTYQIKFDKDNLAEIYERSEIFFCNREEAERILKTTETDIKRLLFSIYELGPKIVVITDGTKGAYTFDGKETWRIRMYPDPKPPVDRTGAGDSFSSAFTVAIAEGNDIPTALMWGPVNSMSVVQYIGAREGLLNKEQIFSFLKTAPPDYKPEKVT